MEIGSIKHDYQFVMTRAEHADLLTKHPDIEGTVVDISKHSGYFDHKDRINRW